MTVRIDPKWQPMIDRLVETGVFASGDDAVDAAFRLLADEERRLDELRRDLIAAEAEGGAHTLDDIERDVAAWFGPAPAGN